ncbi:MAG: hypothetical protein AB8I08_13785 [Sandaracinaceae bacterium]
MRRVQRQSALPRFLFGGRLEGRLEGRFEGRFDVRDFDVVVFADLSDFPVELLSRLLRRAVAMGLLGDRLGVARPHPTAG